MPGCWCLFICVCSRDCLTSDSFNLATKFCNRCVRPIAALCQQMCQKVSQRQNEVRNPKAQFQETWNAHIHVPTLFFLLIYVGLQCDSKYAWHLLKSHLSQVGNHLVCSIHFTIFISYLCLFCWVIVIVLKENLHSWCIKLKLVSKHHQALFYLILLAAIHSCLPKFYLLWLKIKCRSETFH